MDSRENSIYFPTEGPGGVDPGPSSQEIQGAPREGNEEDHVHGHEQSAGCTFVVGRVMVKV